MRERREDGRVLLVLPADVVSGTRYELQTAGAAGSLAQVEVDPTGWLRVNVAQGLHAAFWFSAEPRPIDGATENHGRTWPSDLQWRLLDGQPLPAFWIQKQQRSDMRGHGQSWLEIPVDPTQGTKRVHPLALVDPASDWAWRMHLQVE